MDDQSRMFRKIAILGAGVMGAQIAAHFANTGVPVLLYELADKNGEPNDLVNKALKGLTKLRPTPIASKSALETIRPTNYEQHLELLKGCDLVIEAISEQINWKYDLYEKIAPFLKKDAILASNTSGISISKLAEFLPSYLKSRFCGIHFFNPPRYLYLVELIPHSDTNPELLDALEVFLTKTIGKGVVRAKDTTGFIASRVGSFACVFSVFHHTERLCLPFDLVDKLTGPGIGRAKSATYRTADIVGLDTVALVTEKTLAANLKDDPWHEYLRVPDWLQKLVAGGSVGQKAGIGIYKKVNKDIFVLERESQKYRPVRDDVDKDMKSILGIKDWKKFFASLISMKSTQGEFLLSIFRDLFHYCAYHLAAIAYSARDIDLAIRWGYGWTQGPFEIWQAAKWKTIAAMIQNGIEDGKTMSSAPLPEWVLERNRTGVHGLKGSYSPSEKKMIPRTKHALYKRQLYPDLILGEKLRKTHTVFETKDVRMWHMGDDIAILSFKTKTNTMNIGVIEGIKQAVEEAEKKFKALILWQTSGPFCTGVDLKEFVENFTNGNYETIDRTITLLQKTNLSLKYSFVPTIAAIQGIAVGSGCEVMMHCDSVVAALETYTGFNETSLGLVPVGGGIKEMVKRAVTDANGHLIQPHLTRYFDQVATSKVTNSALEAREMGYSSPCDTIVPNVFEILYVAKQKALSLYESGYRPPQPENNIPVVGDAGYTFLQAKLLNNLKGNLISDHDYLIGCRLAALFSGGEVNEGRTVNENWLLHQEHEVFMELILTGKTQERIQHMLATGKLLRN